MGDVAAIFRSRGCEEGTWTRRGRKLKFAATGRGERGGERVSRSRLLEAKEGGEERFGDGVCVGENTVVLNNTLCDRGPLGRLKAWGGLQEEAPSLGVPVLVLREVTERPEGVTAGVVRVIGTDEKNIVGEVIALMEDDVLYRRMAQGVNPYGDGKASRRIVKALRLHAVSHRPRRLDGTVTVEREDAGQDARDIDMESTK